MKISSVEAIPINPGLAARNADQKVRFGGIDTQTIYKVTTDNNITGYGDCRGHSSLSDVEVNGLLGRSPFDFINANLPTGSIEVFAQDIEVLSKAKELPLPVFGEPDYPEDIRLKHRYLDLRRETLHKNMTLRSDEIECVRRGSAWA